MILAEPHRPILVTGGSGFIGRRLIAALRRAGRVAVPLDDGSVPPRRPLTPDPALISLDIRDTAALTEVVRQMRPAAIVHLAALHHIPTCTAEPQRALSINVLGTQSVLEACASLPEVRVTLASSGAVYAWEQGPLSELTPLAPADIYGISKQTNEAQLALWVRQGRDAGLARSGRIARLFNVIGPDDPNGHLIPDLIDRLLPHLDSMAGPIPLKLGALAPRRDYLGVEDAARGLLALIDDPDETPLDIYNLCSGSEIGVAELAAKIAALMGVKIAPVSDPALLRRIDRPSQWGDPTKARERLGFTLTDSLDDVLRALCQAALSGGETAA